MILALQSLVVALAAFLVAVTLLPQVRTTAWWVRMWEFPRLHILIGLAVLLPATLLFDAPVGWAVALPVAACIAFQALRVLPFTRVWRSEMAFAAGSGPADVTLISSNVLMENRDHTRLADLIETDDPDIILLMETDADWIDALAPTLSRYPTVVAEPLDNHYGMVFATRLPVEDARIVHLTPDGTPSVFAELRDREGRAFRFVGLHPRPPIPGQDTDERDTQMAYAARFAREEDTPVVVLGDFNESAWSHMARRFKRIGGYLDPRIGRGMFASWHADHPLARTPIDQLYVTSEVAVADFRIGGHIGSDHFPVIVRLRLDPDAAARLNREPATLDAEEETELAARLDAYAATLDEPPF